MKGSAMQTSMRRRIASVALAVLVAFGCGALTALAQETAEGQTAYAAQQGTWKKSSGKWWYAYNGGGYAKSGWDWWQVVSVRRRWLDEDRLAAGRRQMVSPFRFGRYADRLVEGWQDLVLPESERRHGHGLAESRWFLVLPERLGRDGRKDLDRRLLRWWIGRHGDELLDWEVLRRRERQVGSLQERRNEPGGHEDCLLG